ncbi:MULTISPECIES: hypothetical protein [Niastella]|uniref:DUF4115 domain-containing protein n=1 Tax=Niastella soli TaxID=2821487 RepID=A0ABS3YNU7_9BACT|nr:hypothetical protein [Niastella soli]MBO9199550.1 hypothetical protein [Niastella soli]
MDKNNEQYYLSRVLEQIETIFNRGASDKWTTYDFEKLSEAIYEGTQVRLSVTTLKRIWGRLKYESAPTLTTLNTLAQFAGFVDWLNFKQNEDRPTEGPNVQPVSPRPQRKLKHAGEMVAGVAILIAGAYFLFLAARHKQNRYDPSQFEFSTNKMISEGVPNSVIFRYTAKVKPDSLFIVQTWDISRKTLVSADKNEHSAIYYYPGFFRTKLIADGQVMKKHDVWITSNGWLCLLEEEPIPIYFKKEQYQKDSIIEVNDTLLAPYRHTSTAPRVRFFNQRDMGDLMNDNFTFETKVKNNFDDGTNACHYAQVLIQCKNDIIIIPLAAKSCVGDLKLYFCGTGAESKSADLSGFGCDLTQWTLLRVETVNKTATIYVNNKKAYTITFPNEPTGIVGVQYRFNGAAAVKDTRFRARGKVYEME